MRKLIVQIPCFNEESSLPVTLADLPRALDGVDVVEWLVIDDGSEDGTSRVARDHGVDHIVRLPRHLGLARAFVAGLDAALAAGADVIVNTDADNQYRAADIPNLIAPILSGEAEIVVGARPVETIEEFSFLKKRLQRLGSWVVQRVSRTDIPDAPSGFRALSRAAAMRVNVFNEYTYTLETVIQAGQKGMAITSVPVRTNESLRPSRLIKSVPDYLRRSGITILRIFVTYKPFRFFALPGLLVMLIGSLIGLRFLYHYVTAGGAGHIQSLILGALLLGSGFLLIVVGLITDLVAVNRQLLERLDWRIQTLQGSLNEMNEIRATQTVAEGVGHAAALQAEHRAQGETADPHGRPAR